MIAGILTYLDAALLAIVAISGLVAMYRGFTREVLSILSWVAAGLALLYFIRSHGASPRRSPSSSRTPCRLHVYIAQVAIGGDHLPVRIDRCSSHHVAHLRHGAR